MEVIKFYSDDDYFERIHEIRAIIENEIGLTQNYISIVHYSNVEIIALILGILAIVTYFSFNTFAIIWVVIGPYAIYKTLQINSGMESLKLKLGFRKIEKKKKISFKENFVIDIPDRYPKFSDIDLLALKIRIVKGDRTSDSKINATNNYLWASAFSMNAFNNQIGYWTIYASIIVLYIYCVLTKTIEFNWFLILFGILQLGSFYYLTALEGNLRYFVINDFKRNFLFFHILWIGSITAYYVVFLISYFSLILQLLTVHNILLLGMVGILEYFVIMLGNDFFSSTIGSGIMNDKLTELIRLRDTINNQIFTRKRLTDDPDIFYYDYLVMRRYKLIKWKGLLFGKYVLEPDLSDDDIRTLSESSLHFEILQGEVGMKGLFVTNKEILKRYGYV
ncbi:hypothetical protein [Methanoregula sp.]|uniref:hypothetical protein n=1 Tax=Methanoregula sp. TaxID=2052170 RepID=UPI00237486DC|nr:hypothetical protein [Methanoregula sp.]MDD1686206.1 hypothetical protein [Methanoregula sp.]